MGLAGLVTTVALSTLVASYLFYALVPVPPELDQRDDVFWIFARQKYLRGMSVVGEFFGFGHRVEVYRQLQASSLLPVHKSVDYTGLKVNISEFDGVPVRIWEPIRRVSNSPGLIWLHGGGWVFGSAENDDILTSELAKTLGVMVIAVNYRLAPEYPFPVPFDDCVKATVFFLEHANEMNVDPGRVAIVGQSAGGNLAAAVSLKLRDDGKLRRPSVLVLLAPCLQAVDFHTPSYQYNANDAFLPSYWMASFWLWYSLGSGGHKYYDILVENQHTSVAAKLSEAFRFVDHNLIPRKYVDATYEPNTAREGDDPLWAQLEPVFLNPYFAPLMATDLKGLPTTFVMTAQRDVLRDDGILFARRLASAGTDVEHHNYEHSFHALLLNFRYFNQSRIVYEDIIRFLSKAF